MALNVWFIFIVFCDECAVKGALTEQVCLRDLLRDLIRAPIREPSWGSHKGSFISPLRDPIREFKGSHKAI